MLTLPEDSSLFGNKKLQAPTSFEQSLLKGDTLGSGEMMALANRSVVLPPSLGPMLCLPRFVGCGWLLVPSVQKAHAPPASSCNDRVYTRAPPGQHFYILGLQGMPELRRRVLPLGTEILAGTKCVVCCPRTRHIPSGNSEGSSPARSRTQQVWSSPHS